MNFIIKYIANKDKFYLIIKPAIFEFIKAAFIYFEY